MSDSATTSDAADDQDLLDLLLAEEGIESRPRLAPRAPDAPVLLSFAQQRLWFLQQLEPTSSAYNVTAAVRLAGSLNASALEEAANDLIARHEVLRTAYPAVEGRVAPHILTSGRVTMLRADFSPLPASDREVAAMRWMAGEAGRAFDLGAAPLLRLGLVSLGEQEHIALLVMHHIVSDAWSMDVLVRELGEAYVARAAGVAPTWAALPLQYADFAGWQRAWLDGGVRAAQLDYWRKQLGDAPVLALPTDRPRTPQPDSAVGTVEFALDREVVAGVRAIADRENATIFMVLLAAFQTFLYRITGQEDLQVGAPVANRTRSELESLIGFFVNTLVLRAQFSGPPDFTTLVRRVKQTSLEAYGNQDIPFEDLVHELQPERDLAENPLFQVMFSVQSVSRQELRLPGLSLTPVKLASAAAKFDLMVGFEEGPARIFGAFEYRTALFDRATIQRLAGQFQFLLGELLQHPGERVARLRLQSASDEARVVQDWNRTQREYPEEAIGHLFAKQVKRSPNAVAVTFGNEQLTYRQLSDRAARLAGVLREAGVGRNVCVGVSLERSLDLIVAIVAVVQAGGAYVALDPEYPVARLELMLRDAAVPVLVTQEKFVARFASTAGERMTVLLDRDAAKIAAMAPVETEAEVTLNDLAYVSFTSGSTGTPKGAAIPHRGVVRLVQNTDFAALDASQVFLQVAPVAFDASTFEIWAPLLNGGRLVVMPPGTPTLEDLGRTIREEKVTTIFLTTGLFNLVADERLEDLRGLKQLLTGGEVIAMPQVRKAFAGLPGCRIIHCYGPTENTTFTTCHPIAAKDLDAATVVIGRPIANTTVYILDEALQAVAVGVPGELYAGGDGVAQGYLNRPESTAQSFVPDPFSPKPGARMYRTGDRACWRADATVEFVGRTDHQVKIRGHRIEPGEVEAALLAQPGVKAVVVVVQGQGSRKRLVAYAVADAEGEELRGRMQGQLPDYLVPAVIVTLPSLPLNANGKVDRAALPAPEIAAPATNAFIAPRDEREQEIAEIWCAVLGLKRVGVRDNYFASGGDSISAIQVASRLRRGGWQVEVRDLFQYPTIADLAPRLKRATAVANHEIVTGPTALTPAQAWFFAHHEEEVRSHFNQAVLLAPKTKIESDAISTVVAELWRQHDALRTVFRGAEAEILAPAAADIFEEVSVADEAVRLAHSETVQRNFDLAQGPLFRAVLYRVSTGDRLLLTAHHLVVDGVSWRILLEDLEIGLRQRTAGQPIELGSKSASVKTWAQAGRERAAEPVRMEESAYWESVASTSTAWPKPKRDLPNFFGEARMAGLTLDANLTRVLLTTVHRAYHTEINDVLLLALARALKRWHGGDSTRVTMEGHGRDPETRMPALDRTVGWFTCLYPAVIGAAGDDLGGQLKRLKETLRAVPVKGAGYAAQAYLREPSQRPAWARPIDAPVSFNYLGQFGEESGGQLAFAAEPTGVIIGARVLRQHEFDAGAMVSGGQMGLSLTYHPVRNDPAAVETILADWRSELETIAAHCVARTEVEHTPSDFTSPVFTLDRYEAFLRAREWSAVEVADVCRLSPMQSGLLFQTIFDRASAAYFIQMAYRVRGTLDVEKFAEAWRLLGQRHSILRTNFVHQNLDEPVQVVWKKRPAEIAVVDLRGVSAADQASRIADARRTDLARGFDLERDSLWRVTMWQTAVDAFEIVWSYHHVLLDGWSLGLVHADLLRLYEELVRGDRKLTQEPVPYRNYIRWLQSCDLEAAHQFWRNHLEGYEQAVGIPRLLGGAATNASVPIPLEHVVEFDPAATGKLRTLAAQAGVTLNVLFQAAWALVLAAHSRSDDVVFGTIVSGRPAGLPGVEEMVGLFICAIPVRVKTTPTQRFVDLLAELQRTALSAEPFHHLPLAEVQRLSAVGGGLFDHLLVFENYPIDRALGNGAEGGLRIEGVEAHDRTHYDLDVTIDPGDEIGVKFGYNRAVYPTEQIERVAGHLRYVLEQVLHHPSALISDLSIASPAEAERVIRGFNDTASAIPRDCTLVDLLEAAATRSPDAAAVIFGEVTLSYAGLHAQANRLAHALRKRGVGPESIVGLCVERSTEMIVGVLGILKAGGAYLPLDPQYPADRLAFMIEDAGAEVFVTQRALASRLPAPAKHVLLLDGPATEWEAFPATAPVSGVKPEQLAYLIYTSGSTGKPKGVMIEHRSLVNAAIAWRKAYGLENGDVRLLQMASLSFDVFAGDFIRALTNGGTLVVCDAETRVDPGGLCELLTRHRVTLFESTPGLILPLMEHVRTGRVALPDLRLLILGSDTLPLAEYRRLVTDFGGTMRIVNSYGVTEATIDSCFFEQRETLAISGTTAPIGRPIANTRLYVLDAQFRPCPLGVAGELFIGGEGLARGYHRRPELTAERFIEVNVTGAAERVYRTGDLARWLDDGDLEFLGRGDQQVKIRGFRVEPGEIEARLRTHETISEVAVVAREIGGTHELVAYIVPASGGEWSPAIWRAHVTAELPEHMAPAFWVQLEKIPLSPNAKVDRRALPLPSAEQGVRSMTRVAPRTPTEHTIAKIWREVLQVAEIGVEDNFFELGGHSLKAMQVASRLQQTFGVRPALKDFFAAPTIVGLARLVQGTADKTLAEPIPAAPVHADYELSFAQQRLWFLHGVDGASTYNMPEAYVLRTALDADVLERAIRRVIARHEVLRTAFVEIDGELRQRILPEVEFLLRRVDLVGMPEVDRVARELADEEAGLAFDLTRPPLLRAALVTVRPGEVIFLFTMHHIVGDGWSSNVLYREIFAQYVALLRGEPDPLPPRRVHYKDFAVWQKARGFAAHEAYWLSQLAGVPETLGLGYDLMPDPGAEPRGGQVQAQLDVATTQALEQLAGRQQTTLSNVGLALFKLLLFQLTKQKDLCVGVSVANREHPDLESLIGFFVNIVPVRTELSAAMEFDDLLTQVITATTGAYEHQEYPFDLLVQKLNPQRSGVRRPVVNVVYSFQNFTDVHIDVGAAPVPVAGRTGAAAEPEVVMEVFERKALAAKFDLTLFAAHEDDQLRFTLEYDATLFREQTARKYLALLVRFAGMIAAAK